MSENYWGVFPLHTWQYANLTNGRRCKKNLQKQFLDHNFVCLCVCYYYYYYNYYNLNCQTIYSEEVIFYSLCRSVAQKQTKLKSNSGKKKI